MKLSSFFSYAAIGLVAGLALVAISVAIGFSSGAAPDLVYPAIAAAFGVLAPLAVFGGLSWLEAVVKGAALLKARDRVYRQRWLARALA